MNKQEEVVPRLLLEFPEFREHWEEHVRYWEGKTPGHYIDMAEFVHFIVEDLYEKGKIDRTQHAFEVLEKMLNEGGPGVLDVISLGFFETLQNFASWRPCGSEAFKPFLGPVSAKIWAELDELWAGKSSLMDVIRAEKESGKT